MEAVPRLPMICFDLKVTHENATFGPKLKQYIAEFYREDPETYNNEIHQLEGLRSAAVRPATDLTGCTALKRYFCQLRSLQSRFPMSKGQPAAVSFAWRDLFANIVCTLADIRFEMVCVLYNIGALHCKLGAEETRTTPESMKAACTHFQSAVWAFQHLKEHYPQPSGVDLSPEIMKLFQDICLAQAQECILEKSMQDNRKPAIVGAIGMQVLQYYKSALAALETSQTADSLHETVGLKVCNVWFKFISFKVSYIGCIIYLFQGMQSEEQQRMGERVSFYQAACDKLQDARKLCKGMSNFDIINEALTFTNDVVEGKRKAAKNENEFIYHEEVPDKDVLPEPKAASLAKGIPVNFNDTEVSGPDIFGRLVPMGAHEASSMYSEEKAKLLRQIGSAAEIKDAQLGDFMSSLQLEQLDTVNQPERLPQDLVDRCASLSVKTDAIQNLIETMNSLADVHTDVETMLSDIKIIIQNEEASEKEFQQVMGVRPPSIVSTELSREANKYLDAHNKANESNQTLHKAMTVHLANLKVLALPLDEIEAHVPSLDSIKDQIDTAAMAEMRTLVAKVNEMQTQRSMLLVQLREAVNSDDITSQLLTRAGESLDEIFRQEIEKHNKQVKLIEHNMLAQENILKALTDAYAKYAGTRKLISDVLRKRDVFLTALITSYDTYEDLLNKSLKGLEFYRKLSGNVSRLFTRVKSTCKVQEEERTQLLENDSSRQIAAAKASLGSGTPSDINISKIHVAPEDTVSTGPKLKDFLPYMKNRNAASNLPDTNVVDSSYSGNMYPPYMRPAPVGSEGNNEPHKSNYSDADQKVYQSEYERFKNYQYSLQQATGVYSTHTFPDRAFNYPYGNMENPPIKPEVGSQNATNPYYQPYGTPMENINTNLPLKGVVDNDQTIYSQNISQNTTMGYHQGLPSQYNQMNPMTYPATGEYAYNYPYGNPNQTLNHTSTQLSNPSMTSNYVSIGTTGYTEVAQNENRGSAIHGNELSSQMQNLNISYSQNSNIPNSYGTVNASLPNYVASLSYNQIKSNPSQTNLGVMNQTDLNAATYNNQCLGIGANSSVPIANNPQPVYSVVGSYPSDTNLSSINPNTTPAGVYETSNNQPYSVNQEYNQNMNQQFNSQYNTYPQQGIHSNITSQEIPLAPSSNLISSHASYGYPQTSDSGYPASFSTTNSDSLQYLNNEAAHQNPSPQQMPPDLPIQSHIQHQFYQQPGISNEIQQPQYYNQRYSSNNAYNTEMLPSNLETATDMYSNMNQQGPPVQSNTIDPNPSAHPNQAQNSSYQNHPGYSLNEKTGAYHYNYGYQNSSNNMAQVDQYGMNSNEDNLHQNLYTSAGTYETMQSDSGTIPTCGTDQGESTPTADTAHYYSVPYGHQNGTENQANYSQVNSSNIPTNNVKNQSSLTYMTSNDTKTNTTSSNQGLSTIKTSPSIDSQSDSNEQDNTDATIETPKEPSTMDLLSGLDFTVEQKPLMPEIRVPPVSENVIRKIPITSPQEENKSILEREHESVEKPDINLDKFERPAKCDLFSDPSLLNKFTQEVKSLQLLVDGLTKKTHSGITMLDSKWKKIQDAQAKETSSKTTLVAKTNFIKNNSPDVIPYDDCRVVIKSDAQEGYVNASHVKQISSWSIPMIVSDLPSEDIHNDFWLMIYQQRVSIIVCLLTEIELQGKFYGPTAKHQKLEFSADLCITLDEINCNVNWTERKMTIAYLNNQHQITHYQINVFPARVVSAPLVQLVDKVLNTNFMKTHDDDLPKVLVHCSTGAGRSALIVSLIMVMCQVRAGYVDLRDMLDSGFLYLSQTRTNILEDTKYLVDIYRTVLFYVQGVLCSGSVSFNGEAVSVPSGASVPPPHIPNSRKSSTENLHKFSKESFEEMKQAAGLKSGDMKDPLSYLDPLWSLKKRKD